ncbi:TrbI/VirB10 family protein, partial [Vibrio mediterranei]
NFGKNGIAGTAIMRNSKIIQSAGVAGILTGLGNAATGLSQTQSTSALGTTNSVDPSKTGLNILGTATSEVAAKLSDYYLKLAEKYHPDIELRQGAVVNIVFLKGFPLYDTEQYAKAMDAAKASAQSQVTTLTASPAAALLNAANQNLGRATGRP